MLSPSKPLPANVSLKLGQSDRVALVFFVSSLVLGGGGSPSSLIEAVLQAILAVLAVLWLWTVPRSRLADMPLPVWLIAAVLVAIPALQLVPLPPAIWHALPGRGDELAALRLIGHEDGWRPLALNPWRTLGSLMAMVAAAVTIVMAASLTPLGRTAALACVVVVAALSLVLGAAQLTGGFANVFRIYVADSAFLDGFQANHSSEADLLLVAMVFLAGVVADLAAHGLLLSARRYVLLVFLVGTIFLILGVVLTASRTGIVLLPVALLAQIVILRHWLALRRANLRRSALAIAALLVVVAAGLLTSPPVQHALGRFSDLDVLRPQVWVDTVYAIRQYLPWGSGMGSFIPSFAAIERLEIVGQKYVNRAHNDYLELALEAGVPGVLGLLAIIGVVLHSMWRAHRRGDSRRDAQLVCAVAVFVILALHSLIDYPLRSMSLACIAAICVALAVTSHGAHVLVGKAKEWS